MKEWWGIVDNYGDKPTKRGKTLRSKTNSFLNPLRSSCDSLACPRRLAPTAVGEPCQGDCGGFGQEPVFSLKLENMFIGEYQHSIDSKGRVAVPVKFRRDLGSGAIITRGLDRCLFVFGTKEWELLAQKLNAMPFAKADARAFARSLLAGAMDVQLDKQGRILIPDYLRNYSHLKKQVVIAGVYSRIEIWDTQSWQEYKSKIESSGDEIAEKLGELGI